MKQVGGSRTVLPLNPDFEKRQRRGVEEEASEDGGGGGVIKGEYDRPCWVGK